MPRSFTEQQEALFQAYGEGRYRDALDLARQVQSAHPSRAARADYWTACLLCKLGRPDEALHALQASLDQGRWANPLRLRTDDDFDPLRGNPELTRIIEECERRRDLQQRDVRPELRVLAPAFPAPPVPAGARITLEGPHEYAWAMAAKESWPTIMELRRAYAFDPERLVLGGASQGARLAVAMAVRGAPMRSRGFIALVGAPPVDRLLTTPIPVAAAADVRGVFITGEVDFARADVERAHAVLREAGMAVRLEVVPGLGHAYPTDFGERLTAALDFVLA